MRRQWCILQYPVLAESRRLQQVRIGHQPTLTTLETPPVSIGSGRDSCLHHCPRLAQPAATPHEQTAQPLTDCHLEFRQSLRRDANVTPLDERNTDAAYAKNRRIEPKLTNR